MTKKYERLAGMVAAEASEDHFHRRLGVCVDERRDLVVLYNNNPWPGRGRELSGLRRRLAEKGIKELAYAEYPSAGEDQGYTFAMVVDSPVAFAPAVGQLALDAMVEAVGGGA